MWELASIVVGHYCELNSHLTGLIYVLLTNRRSKLISLNIRLASEIIILLAHTKALPVIPASIDNREEKGLEMP